MKSALTRSINLYMYMAPVLVDLTPNRLLLNSNFEGYKLSLREIQRKRHVLPETPDRILLNTSSQYSLLHAKLFGLHNHLVGDPFESAPCVYYVDSEWNVNKTYVDPLSDELIAPVRVWQVPRSRERKIGDYNVSIKFVSRDIALIGDGTGLMYILETGERNNDDTFAVAFKDEITGEEKGFVVADGVLTKGGEELHVLLKSIEQEKGDSHDVFSTVLHWISFDRKDGKWNQVSLRRLKTKGHIQYAALEQTCETVYIVGDNECKFVLNSDYPIVDEPETTHRKCYLWEDELDNVTFKIIMPDNTRKDLINVHTNMYKLEVKYDSKVVLCGTLPKSIIPGLTTWSIERDILEVNLIKFEGGLWTDLIKDDQTVLDFCIVEEAHHRLAHLHSENKDAPQEGTTFNSQQIEECDFENDKSAVFERLDGTTNSATHKINLGSHQVLLAANLSNELPPAIGIRHDVDVCLWQPQGGNGSFSMSHEGTLLAFGYVQASKQNRKFSVCSPSMEYSAICESCGHIFIYRQKKAVTSGELKNRTTGRMVANVAEQQVVNMSNEEILGVYPFDSTLFVLTGGSITALEF